MELVDLWDKRRYRVGTMSGGECRRVANAAALVHHPRLVLGGTGLLFLLVSMGLLCRELRLG